MDYITRYNDDLKVRGKHLNEVVDKLQRDNNIVVRHCDKCRVVTVQLKHEVCNSLFSISICSYESYRCMLCGTLWEQGDVEVKEDKKK
jgi:hypothetical protein